MENIVGEPENGPKNGSENGFDNLDHSEAAELLASAEAQLMAGVDTFRQQARDDISDLRARLAVVGHLRDIPEDVQLYCRQHVQNFAQNMADVSSTYNCLLGNDIALALRDMIAAKPQINKAFLHAVELHLLMLEYAVGEYAWVVDSRVCSEIRRNLGQLSESVVAAITVTKSNVVAFSR